MDKKYPTTEDPMGDRRGRLPEKLSRLRQKLYQKAKQEPKFRFYALYDRIYRKDVLWAAWEQVRRNKGAAGVDEVSIDDIDAEEGKAWRLVGELHEALRTKTYKPEAVRRVYIPKPDGRKRPLGIPTVADRIVQTACLLILEPIFEADFLDCSYGFRPQRSAHQALDEIRSHIKAGHQAVYDADLKGYFDAIPHNKLLACVGMRVTDRSVLKLIRLWLKAPVIVPPKSGGESPKVVRKKQGTPQGGVISPLLANLYLHWFDKVFHHPDGPARWAGAKLVRYADDFLVLARYQGNRLTSWIEKTLEGWMSLEINREKTRVIHLKRQGESLDFLGFTLRYDRDLNGKSHPYLNLIPSKKALLKERETLRQMISSRNCFIPLPDLIGQINLHLQGWANYFRFGYPRKAFRSLNAYVRNRLTHHLRRRSQRPFKPKSGVSYYAHLKKMGLAYL